VLCHMVGDLLTGEIRPGLVRKWESTHARALTEVHAAGLSLVQDELSDEELEQSAFPDEESPFDEAPETAMVAASNEDDAETEANDNSPFELPDFAETSDTADTSSADPFDNMPELPDLAEAGPAAETEAQPEPEPAPEPEPELFEEEPEPEERPSRRGVAARKGRSRRGKASDLEKGAARRSSRCRSIHRLALGAISRPAPRRRSARSAGAAC